MNLSKIIKSEAPKPTGNGILTTRPGLDDLIEAKFHSLDSLWQSGDPEYIDTMNKLQAEKEAVKQQTEEMLAKTQAEVDRIEQEAHEKGFAAGKEEAAAIAEKELKDKLTELDKLLKSVEADRRQLHGEYENDIITLVKTMVDRAVFHEVSVNPMVIQACLKTALSYVVENSTVNVHLHSNDLNRLKEVGLDNPDLLSGFNQLELTEGPGVSEGGCLLETSFGEVDATLEERRGRLYKAIDAIFMKANQETGDRSQDSGDRIQETGDRNQK